MNPSIQIDEISLIVDFLEKNDFLMDKEFDHVNQTNSLWDDNSERDFAYNWIEAKLGRRALNWFIPQASLDTVLSSYKEERKFAQRRVDFLFCHPLSPPLVVEIDGSQHSTSVDVDKDRDDALAQVGIKVRRIPLSQISTSPQLSEIEQYCNEAIGKVPKLQKKELIDISKSLYESSICSKVQFAILLGLENGWLKNNQPWNLELEGLSSIGFYAVKDLLNMIINLTGIYNIDCSPSEVRVKIHKSLNSISADQNLITTDISHEIENFKYNLKIKVDSDNSILHEIVGENDPDCPDIIVRPTYLPVPLRIDSIFTQGRLDKQRIKKNIDKKSLQIFLMNIFRKKDFREQQADAIINILSNRDSAVLLPTGAGKSIIYQLAGMLMPGITAVVDPIIALVEDQVDVLKTYGISRAAPIRSGRMEELEDILARAEMGEFYFMLFSPERLQSPRFRTALTTLRNISLINLAVIDEAHCVSEWGHDFRPAYLNLRKNIKELMKDRRDSSPPIIALTGTASRAVLKDVMTELELNQLSDPVIKPKSFDRSELNFWIRTGKNDQEINSLAKAAFDELPKQLKISRSELYSTNGNKTFSGLVFGPHVNGDHGIRKNQQMVHSLTNADVNIFSGSCPKGMNFQTWEDEKRRFALDFKENKVPILVATKAFGMGIDKPNIRYTLHLGIPSSLEGFYQEAGRAGRSRKSSYCGIIFVEHDKKRTDELLDEKASFKTLKEKYKKNERVYPDDIIRQLYFHVNNFPGIDEELNQIRSVINDIEKSNKQLVNHKKTEIPRSKTSNENKDIEKAIHRLVRIGFVDDYQVDYGSSKFIVHSAPFDLDSSIDKLLDYIGSAQPGVINVYKNKLDDVKSTATNDNKETIILLSKNLIEFTYEVIEKGRRTALKQMVELARSCYQNSEIRERILEYLTEGPQFTKIIDLIQNPDIEKSLPNLFNLIEGVDVDHYGDLRGEAQRNLVSYPDHPGLVLISLVTEIILTKNETIVLAQLSSIFSKEPSSSRSRYGLNDKVLYSIFNWLFSFAQKNSNILLKNILKFL